MKTLATLLSALALIVSPVLIAYAEAETKVTHLGINWVEQKLGKFETVHLAAKIPSAMLYFVRDIEGASTDQVSIYIDGGIYCSTLVESAAAIRLDCGTTESRFMVLRSPSTNGQLTIRLIEELPDPPPKKDAESPKPNVPFTPGYKPKSRT